MGNFKRNVSGVLAAMVLSGVGFAASQADEKSDHAAKTLEIYRTVIGMRTAKGQGNVPKMAAYLASELKAAGFADDDIHILPSGKTAALVVRYRGDGSADKKPILFIGHMDVVDALESDWVRPPFTLTEDDTYYYGRGTVDNKMGVTNLTSTFIRLKKAGFVPTRDLVIAFSGDEETGMITTRMLAYDRRDLTDAEYALNSDAGGGDLGPEGAALLYGVQAAEKTYVSFELTVRNAGGHSSRPRKDNAIYELVDALKAVQAYHFPIMSNDLTRQIFRATGQKVGGKEGAAMIAFADNPNNIDAAEIIAEDPSFVGSLRTTCIATMLRAGHAENALPQSATATVNCRIFPGIEVATVRDKLQELVGNDKVEFVTLDEPVASPVSPVRDDVVAAVKKAIQPRYGDIPVMGYMESGGTDGMHFRRAGIPTLAISSIFMKPSDMFAHGLNERLPKKSFQGGLDHWTIIIKELAGH